MEHIRASLSTALNQRYAFRTDNFFCKKMLEHWRKKYLTLTIWRSRNTCLLLEWLFLFQVCGWSGHFSGVDEKDLQQKAFIFSLRYIHSWFLPIHSSIHILLCPSCLTQHAGCSSHRFLGPGACAQVHVIADKIEKKIILRSWNIASTN